jgi:hypothetical protein
LIVVQFLARLFDGLSLRRARIAAPLAALIAIALSAIVLAAQTGLALCGNRIALPAPMDSMHGMGDVPMAGMPGMSAAGMPGVAIGHHLIMICPVIFVMIVASTLIAAVAIVIVARDSDRAATLKCLARSLARLPVLPTAASLVASAAVAVALMIAVDGNGVPSSNACAAMAAILLISAVASAALAHVLGTITLAFSRRLIGAMLRMIAQRSAGRPPQMSRRSPFRTAGQTLRLFAAGCGLRAPPSFVR